MAQLDNCFRNVLTETIPQGGFGRNLTATEVKILRTNGIKATKNWVVIRKVFDIDGIGLLYSPARGGGYNNESVEVL